MVHPQEMNPRKKFKPRNSNSNTENELPAIFGQIVSHDSRSSTNKQHTPNKQKQLCAKNWQNAPKQGRSSPNKNSPNSKRQLNYDSSSNSTVLTEQQQQQPSNRNPKHCRRTPRKNSPKPTPDITAPKLSFSSPNAAEVPLPPTHWFSCSREMLDEVNISARLKHILNVV